MGSSHPDGIPKPKTAAEKQARVKKILAGLDKMYPDVTCALHHSNAWELLVATILSAQCTDKRVNEVTPGLFRKYPTIQDFAAVAPEVLAQDIRSTGFFNNKAKSVTGAARRILSEFGGKVPQEMEQLLTVPGAARKTANVVLGTGVRNRFRSGGGHARPAHLQSPGPDQGIRSRQDRKGSDEDHSQGEVDSLLAPDHSSRPSCLRSAQSTVRRCVLEPLCYSKDKTI